MWLSVVGFADYTNRHLENRSTNCLAVVHGDIRSALTCALEERHIRALDANGVGSSLRQADKRVKTVGVTQTGTSDTKRSGSRNALTGADLGHDINNQGVGLNFEQASGIASRQFGRGPSRQVARKVKPASEVLGPLGLCSNRSFVGRPIKCSHCITFLY